MKKRRRPIPFSFVAPATIIFFGAAVTFATIWIGLEELRNRAREVTELQARTLAQAFAQRFSGVPARNQAELTKQAAALSGSLVLVLDDKSTIRFAEPEQPLSNQAVLRLRQAPGEMLVGERPHYFASAPVPEQDLRIVVLSPQKDLSASEQALVSSVLTFATLLMAAAGIVGWALSRDVHADVLFVRDRIAAMAKESGPPEVKSVPVRTIDQVGELTASFNMLLERFAAAERAYRQDLSQARDFDKDRSAFLSALSHELRTPLNVILGFTDVLLDEIDGPLSEEARENLTIVRTSAEHLRSLIDDILALSALESGEFRLSREYLDVASVAREVVSEARVTAEQKGLTLLLEHPDEPAVTTAYADRRRLRQILQNVVSNAVKFTNSGTITVAVYREDESVIASVKDTGPGIAQEQLEAIFEEFRQVDTQKASRAGTGLGLSITRRLVQMHGGSVRVRSEVGVGSTFLIRIPTDEPTANANLTPLVPRPSEPVIREA